MMTVEFTAEQRAAIDAPFEASLQIAGASRTGKTTALRARAARYHEKHGSGYFFATHPCKLVSLASIVLEVAGTPVQIADAIEARRAFADGAAQLFDLTWPELRTGAIDPEVAALRGPQWFLDAAYRLVRKLRDGGIDPHTFLERSLAGATDFYAKPPNFAHAELIAATKDAYRDSLNASPEELQRQYRREVDLAKIVHKLYERYVAYTNVSDALVESDAIARAVDRLRERPELATAIRERYAHAFIDEMQEATPMQRALLDAIYGTPLCGVSFAGDARAATSRFKGARPEIALAGASQTIELTPATAAPEVLLHRAKTLAEEAAYVAQQVHDALERGVPPGEIALLFRSCADVQVYLDALLDCDIPAAIAGDVNVFAERHALDALALLWNVWDPFRHEWLLRTLSGKALALSDASVAVLCADPPDPQTALFTPDPEQAPTERTSRWNPKRDVRLGWNVLRGETDVSLNEGARARIRQFRELREGWVRAMSALPLDAFVRKVWSEGLARDGAPGSARARAQQHILRQRVRSSARVAASATRGDARRPLDRHCRTGRERLRIVRRCARSRVRATAQPRCRAWPFVCIRGHPRRTRGFVSALVRARCISLESDPRHDSARERRVGERLTNRKVQLLSLSYESPRSVQRTRAQRIRVRALTRTSIGTCHGVRLPYARHHRT